MYLNRRYNKFIVLYDTEELLNSLITVDKKHKNESQKLNSRSRMKKLDKNDIKKIRL